MAHNHKFQIGDKVRIKVAFGNVKVGDIGTVTNVDFTSGNVTLDIYPNWVAQSGLELALTTPAEIQAYIEGLEKQITQLRHKLEYLKETGAEKFDDTEYKAYVALGVAEDTKRPRIERARMLADLIRGN